MNDTENKSDFATLSRIMTRDVYEEELLTEMAVAYGLGTEISEWYRSSGGVTRRCYSWQMQRIREVIAHFIRENRPEIIQMAKDRAEGR